ncbi:MAG: hypothetical protein Q8R02_23670 [Hyphomonadaceae bacterium]|nr:hypothetical protein [Hyphomonadaceae bacterium]
MPRLALIAFAALALSGCINWQGGYDQAARNECGRLASPDERRACLDAVERNASEKRADRRT